MGFRRSEVRILSPRPDNPRRAGNLRPGPFFVRYPSAVMWANSDLSLPKTSSSLLSLNLRDGSSRLLPVTHRGTMQLEEIAFAHLFLPVVGLVCRETVSEAHLRLGGLEIATPSVRFHDRQGHSRARKMAPPRASGGFLPCAHRCRKTGDGARVRMVAVQGLGSR